MLERRGEDGEVQHVFAHSNIGGVGRNCLAHEFFPQHFYPRLVEVGFEAKFLQHILHRVLQGEVVFLFHGQINAVKIRQDSQDGQDLKSPIPHG